MFYWKVVEVGSGKIVESGNSSQLQAAVTGFFHACNEREFLASNTNLFWNVQKEMFQKNMINFIGFLWAK